MNNRFTLINIFTPYHDIPLNIIGYLADYPWAELANQPTEVYRLGDTLIKEMKKYLNMGRWSWVDMGRMILLLSDDHKMKLQLLLQNAVQPIAQAIHQLATEGKTDHPDFRIVTAVTVDSVGIMRILFPEFAKRILPKDIIVSILENDDLVTMRAHINNGDFNLYAKNSEGGNLLHGAAAANALEIATFLVEGESFDLNKRDDRGVTPLLHAVHAGHLSMVQYLLSMGSDPTIKAKDQFGIYDFAIFSGNEELIDFIESHPDWLGPPVRQLLSLTTARHEQRIIRQVKEGKLPMRAVFDKKTVTLMQLAINQQLIEVINYLIDHHEGIHEVIPPHFNPLEYAIFQNQLEIAKLLLSKGVSFNNDSHGIYITNAVLENFGEDVFFEWLEKGLPAPKDTFSIGLYASYHGLKRLLTWYIEKGYSFNKKVNNWTILANLLVRNHVELLPLILPLCDVNWHNKNRIAVIYYAVGTGNYEVVKQLIELGYHHSIRPNKNSFERPLHYALRLKKKDIVEVLLAAGASPNKMGNQWHMPYKLAKDTADEDIIQLVNGKYHAMRPWLHHLTVISSIILLYVGVVAIIVLLIMALT